MKGSDHLIKLAFERRVRIAWPIRWGGGSARKLVAAPKDHLFVIVDARRACLNPDSIRNFPPSDPASCRCDTGKRGWRKMEEGRCASREQKEVAGDDAEVPSSGMQGDADSPRFLPVSIPPSLRAFTLLFTPSLPSLFPSTPLSVFFHSEAYTPLSILRFL